jgi:hypothetical protein
MCAGTVPELSDLYSYGADRVLKVEHASERVYSPSNDSAMTIQYNCHMAYTL